MGAKVPRHALHGPASPQTHPQSGPSEHCSQFGLSTRIRWVWIHSVSFLSAYLTCAPVGAPAVRQHGPNADMFQLHALHAFTTINFVSCLSTSWLLRIGNETSPLSMHDVQTGRRMLAARRQAASSLEFTSSTVPFSIRTLKASIVLSLSNISVRQTTRPGAYNCLTTTMPLKGQPLLPLKKPRKRMFDRIDVSFKEH